jgi:predicted acetyltransferase
MADPYPVRPVGPDELAAFHEVDMQAFYGRPPSDRFRDELLRRLEFDRSLAAFDGGTPVGIAGVWSIRLCLPGAMAPAAGVTWVAVMPTHRRRGILSSLMRRQLADVRERGEPIAALWASEAQIYGRYGYGAAAWHATFTFRRGEGALSRNAPADAGLRLRIAVPDEVRAELAKVYDTVLPGRPGMFARDEHWWDRALATIEDGLADGDPLRCLLAEDDSGPRGYAVYWGRSRWDEETFLADSTLNVREMVAADPAAAAAIWADLLSRDLTTEFNAALRPVDDPLLYLLADPRRARPRISDGLWIRLTDLPRALALRRYACPVDVVLEVTDATLPENQGRWRLATSGAPDADGAPGLAAGCERTTAPADLVLDVSSLGAAYLGGTRLGALAGAGLVTERRRGALGTLSAAMSWDPAPWCPVIF